MRTWRWCDGIKGAVGVPVIGSLNGSTPGGWTDYATRIQEAGADALELNLYDLATDPGTTGAQIEQQGLDVVRAVKAAVSIPVAVKISPFYSSIANFARRAAGAGADGLVLFNRSTSRTSTWTAWRWCRTCSCPAPRSCACGCAGWRCCRGVWTSRWRPPVASTLPSTSSRALMAGADSVQMVSALLLNGPAHVARVLEAVSFWMSEHDYESVRQMVGSMSLLKAPKADALERANYVKVLDSWSK